MVIVGLTVCDWSVMRVAYIPRPSFPGVGVREEQLEHSVLLIGRIDGNWGN